MWWAVPHGREGREGKLPARVWEARQAPVGHWCPRWGKTPKGLPNVGSISGTKRWKPPDGKVPPPPPPGWWSLEEGCPKQSTCLGPVVPTVPKVAVLGEGMKGGSSLERSRESRRGSARAPRRLESVGEALSLTRQKRPQQESVRLNREGRRTSHATSSSSAGEKALPLHCDSPGQDSPAQLPPHEVIRSCVGLACGFALCMSRNAILCSS